MAIIDVGKDFQFEGTFGQEKKPQTPELPAQQPASKTSTIDPRDYNDLVNTVIAEAGGEGPEGMAAVTAVIKNRAARRNQGIGDVVRAPKQFEGYENPGAGSQRAQQDPNVRAQAEQIVNGVLDGSVPDVTGGADHFKNDTVDPDWSHKMPAVARIGGQTFYNSEGGTGRKPKAPAAQAIENVMGLNQQPQQPASDNRRGLARLVPEDPAPKYEGKGGALHFVHKGQDKLNPQFDLILRESSKALGIDYTITSGYRSPQHPVEARKEKPGEHALGEASDINLKGMNDQQRMQVVQDLRARGVKRFGTYSDSPDMLHVDMKDQTGNGTEWFMHDRTARRMGNAPEWFREVAKGKAPTAIGSRSSGKAIEVGADFAPADPLGILAGQENPFGITQPTPPAPEVAAPEAAQADAANPMFQQLEAKEPGRYKEMTEDEYKAFKTEFDAKQPSLMTDMTNMFMGGVFKGIGQTIRGAGALATSVAAPTITDIINPIFGTDYTPSNPLAMPADWMNKFGKSMQESPTGVSAATREAIAGSSPDGDILKPSTWTLGSNPSVRGYMALGLDVFGSMAPVVAGVIATGGGATTGMAVGGLQGGGAAEQTAHEVIDEMAKQPGMLEKESAYYREQIASGKTREQAVAATREAAGQSAFIWTLPVSALGGAATAKIIHPASGMFEGRNIAARVAGRAGASAAEEGSQEVGETVATRHGVNLGAGTDLNETDGTFADFLLGAIGGSIPGAGGGLLSKRGAPAATETQTAGDPTTDPASPAPEPSAPAEPARRKGPLERATEYGAAQNVQKFTIDDGPIGDMGPGRFDGQTVTLADDQRNVPPTMRRVVLPNGEITQIGNDLLKAQSPRPMPRKGAAPEGAPKPGATVRVDAPGIDPFMGRIESYEDGEAQVIDSSTGEVMQIPIGSLTQIAKAPDEIMADEKAAKETAAPAERPIITQGMRSQIEGMGYTPEAIRQMSPEQADDILKNGKTAVTEDTLPAAEPIGGERTSALPPESDQIKAASRPQGPPTAGERVIVQAPGIDRFSARIERWENDGREAVVTNAAGTEMQVSLDDMYVTKETAKQAEQKDLKTNPPVEREKIENTPQVRTVAGKQVVMPDPLHAQLFDLGRERLTSKRLLGASMLDLDNAFPAKQGELADKLSVTPQSLGALADDYRYRVERAAKEARSDLPVNMHEINAERLKKARADRVATDPMPVDEKAEAEKQAKQAVATWWDSELNDDQRKDMLAKAGVKRSEKFIWKNHKPNIQAKLLKFRTAPIAAAPIDIAANAAATSPENDRPEPTQAQKEAGNYALGHVSLGGLNISIENPAGSDRKGVDSKGNAWSVKMKSHYGYFKGTVGRDKDHIDTFVKPGTAELNDASPIFIVDQRNPNGTFDEHKVMTGYASDVEARVAYNENYAKSWKGMGAVTETTLGDFKRWLSDGDTTKPFALQSDEATVAKAPVTSDTPPFSDVWNDDEHAKQDALARLAMPVQGGDKRLTDEVLRGGTDAELLAVADKVFGTAGAGGNRYLIESRPGPKITITLEKDEGNERSVLEGKPLAKALRKTFNFQMPERTAERGEPTPEPKRRTRAKAVNNADSVDQNADIIDPKSDTVDQQPDKTTPPAPADWGSANKLVSRDRADEIRAKLRAKLNGQITSGIDPEILALGTELAAFHIEAGARRFADFARAVASDMGVSVEKVRPFLRAWYNGARDLMEDSGIDIAGTDDATAVRAALATLNNEEPANGRSAKLDDRSPATLEGTPSESVQRTEESGQAGRSVARSGAADLFGNEPVGEQRVSTGRSVADGARKPSDTAGGRSAPANTRPADNAPDATSGSQRSARDANRVDASQSVATPAADRPIDYTLSDADELGQGGAKGKFNGNVKAIQLLRTLESENRSATRDEQAVLAKWVGWGGLRPAFAREDGSVTKGWEKEAAALKQLLTPEEFKAAESSTRNAHYTSTEVVEAIWRIAQRLGFQGGQVLEPSVGAGNFLGLMPGAMRDGTTITGVELDHITGGIAKNLYPAANIQAPVGFQDLAIPDGHFDLAIGNPPFGSERLYDKARRALNKFSIHNFFFAKSVDGLKPGGVLAMVVTNSFLDAGNATARKYISDRADLIGAIRLPNNAFQKNAGTDVTTDIILLQKREPDTAPSDASWVELGSIKDKEGRTVPLNAYFVSNPDMMLGEFGAYGTMYRGDEAALVARPGEDLSEELDKAMAKLPQGVMKAPGAPVVPEVVTVPETVEDAQPGSMFLSPDGTVHVRAADSLGKAQSTIVDLGNEKAKERVSGMIRIRDAFSRLRRAQIDAATTDAKLINLRKRLNDFYDAFAKKHGPINSDANKRLFRDDPTWPQISALEEGFDRGISAAVAKTTGETARGPSAKKAPIFTKRTQEPYSLPTSATSAKDALATVLADRGRVDLDAMAKLYGKSADAIIKELGPLVYKTPSGAYETADDYLSGNVKQKLAEAQRASETDADYRRNVSALRDVIPADIEPVDIDVKPGAPWLPANHVADFVDLITDTKGSRAFYSKANAKWVLEGGRPTEAAAAMWGTGRTSVQAVLDAAMNGQTITVRDVMRDGSSVVNQAATDAANEKLERVKAEWKKWLWQDDARREQLGRLYNDTFNTDVLRTFDGSHLSLPGKVGDDIINLRPHQKNFIWRTLQSGTALADHTVGAGKTFALIGSIMEKRRMGQAKKPMLTVPNHLVGQWAADFIKLYPGAKVLAATKKDFEAGNRKRLFARVATGDWDAVIVAHSSFGKIGVSPEFEGKFIQEQLDDLEASIRAVRAATGEKSRNVAQLSKARDNMQAKLQRLLDAGAKDDGLTFDELGVDALYVDELHEFKNLAFSTSMQRVAGLGNAAGSQKAADMYMKMALVLERTGGQNVVTATGTPISNTMAEMYTLQRFLDNKALKELGLAHFDAWARVFGDVVTDWELSPSGQYKLNSRFARFVNMPELMQRYLSFADVITNDDIKAQLAAIGKTLPLPNVKGGKPQNVVVERSLQQAKFIGEGTTDKDGVLSFPQGSLVYRAEHLPKKAEKGGDNMLKVMSDARKAALDMRLIDASYPDTPGSKVHIAADTIKRIHGTWNEKKGTQLVFIDLSTPKKAKAKEEAAIRELMRKAEGGDEAAQTKLDGMSPDEFMALDSKFSVYDDLKEKLIQRGIPESEIAFIHDANTDLQKEELFGKVRSGRIRVLLGSTPKMGAGTNVQNRLVALHHLDAPWRPSDLEQRDGRGIRQGNELYGEDPVGFEIEILRYATKNTLDARQWQTIEGKARFIQQMRKGGTKTREIEDIAGEAANSAEMKAAASGNPLILEEMDLRQKVRRLEGQSAEHDREQHRIVRRVREMTEEKELLSKRMPATRADAAKAMEAAGKPFSAVVSGETIEKPKDFGAALVAAGRKMVADESTEVQLGTYAGFNLSMERPYSSYLTVNIEGSETHEIDIRDIEDADALGTAMRIINTVRKLPDVPHQIEERVAEIENQVPQLEKQLGPWQNVEQLEESTKRHREVLDALKPKAKPAPASSDEAVKNSIADGRPVATISGDELGVDFRGPDDMPALRQAAAKWYAGNLQGTTATMQDGTVVSFSRKGMGKSTSNNKGDILLRSIPAIRAIVENGDIVHREPGNKPQIAERILIAAPIEFAGTVRTLAVSVHKTATGHYQYDFTFDRDADDSARVAPTNKSSNRSMTEGKTDGEQPRVNREGPTPSEGPLPSFEVPQLTAGDINLFEFSSEINKSLNPDAIPGDASNTTERVRNELDQGVVGPLIGRLIEAGKVTIGTKAELVSKLLADGKIDSLDDISNTSQGFTLIADNTIHLVSDNLQPGTATAVLLHEAFHMGAGALLKGATWQSLMKSLTALHHQYKRSGGAARRYFDAASNRLSYAAEVTGPMSEELTVEELGAYAIEEYELAPASLKKWVDGAIGTVKAWLLRRFGRQIGIVTPAQLRALAIAALRDATQPTEPTGPGAGTRSTIRNSIAANRIVTITQDKIINEVRGKLVDLQPKLLKAVPLNYFTELAQPNMTAVSDYLLTKRALDAYRGKKQAAADTVVQRWLKYTRLGWLSKDKSKAAELARIMHNATLAGVDPANTDQESRAHADYRQLRADFMALPPVARELYVEVRDSYKAQADELDTILLDNVRKAHEIAQRRAEAEHLEEIERITKARMSDFDKAAALDASERAYVGASTRAGWSMKARLTKMRVAFESSRVQGPYFPLARHGRYFVAVKDVDGTTLSFSLRESEADRNRLEDEMRTAYPTAKIDTGVTESRGDMRQAMDPRILAEIQTILGGTGLDGSTMNTVLDQIWQRYLETMPDLSTRKKFIHRKGTAGFDEDALRSYAEHMFHAAHQMGRLKYGQELQELTNNAADQAKKAPDRSAGMTLANELKKRHEWVMNPTGSQLAQTMTSTAFVWFLGTSPASALVNISQTPMVGIPMLAARFGSFAKASAAIAKASADSVRGKGTIVNNPNLSAEERHAMQAFYDSGMIDKTQAHDLAGVGTTGVDASVWQSRVMHIMSWAFHKTETWNREVTAIAAYRMARAAGQNETDAINTAHDLTWKTHFDYSNSNRPAIMQNDFAKVALVFRTHNINILYRVARDLHQSFKGATPAARKEARYQLAGIFGMMSLMAGVTGSIGFNIAMMAAGAIFGDDDDPLGFENEFKRNVTDILGPELGGVVLNGVPGHYLGIDLSSRIGMPDLWFRSPSRDLQGKDEYNYWVMQGLGALGGLGQNMYSGVQFLKEGEVARGVETMAPKFAKDLLKSYRYGSEGVLNPGGDEVIAQKDMGWADLGAQAIGFTPAKVNETYDRNNSLKNAESRVLKKRSSLINAWVLAAQQNDADGKREALERIKKFNAVPIYRPLAIGADTLQRSMKTRARNAAKREDGALIANPHLGKMLREALPSRTTD